MKPLTTILISVVLSLASAAVLVLAMNPTEVEGQVVAEPSEHSGHEELIERLEAQERLIRDLSVKVELGTPQAAQSARTEDLESVVRRVLEKERALAAADSVTTSAERFNVTRAHDQFLRLKQAGASDAEIAAFWDDVRKRGSVEEVLTAFEEHALANPNDIEAQIELGNAYLARLEDATTGPEMGAWAMKADGAFNSALELDESNWEARFSKAVSLSFWPPIFGKQGEAIDQFEILLEKQKSAAPNSNHAQTYKYLGNLYQQQGDSEKAKAIWQEGYAAFPDDEALAEKFKPDSSN